jgi:hypothetical protein
MYKDKSLILQKTIIHTMFRKLNSNDKILHYIYIRSELEYQLYHLSILKAKFLITTTFKKNTTNTVTTDQQLSCYCLFKI